MTKIDELRIITKTARMYYERDLRQNEIAERLGISQATVSRLLKSAKNEGIVRINVNVPNGVNTEIEEALIQKFGLKEAIIVGSANEDEDENERMILREIGSASAYYVETVIKNNEAVGISSWSETLLALVDAMQQVPGKTGIQVVQILGGIGNPSAEVHANRLTGRFASLVNGIPHFLPTPGIVGSEAALKVILNDPYVKEAFSLFEHVSMALVGIGALQPSKLLYSSGNIFSSEEQDILRSRGAVGDILLHFYDANGEPVDSPINKRVVSMPMEQLKKVDRAVGVAAGKRKYPAILGALRGKWINVLITDRSIAEQLLKEA
jgi:DNA-binding transcriptional regulator LsrR (DeoR family)